jgi:hypothetical protein
MQELQDDRLSASSSKGQPDLKEARKISFRRDRYKRAWHADLNVCDGRLFVYIGIQFNDGALYHDVPDTMEPHRFYEANGNTASR